MSYSLKTSIIILTNNKLDYTKECLDSVIKFTDPDSYEIIIIDNNSEDDTAKYLQSFKNRNKDILIKTIFNKTNSGFPMGCNQGIKASSFDHILLLNNDTVVTHNWLDNLLKCISSSERIGAVGPVTNYCSNYQAISTFYKSMDEMHLFARQHNISDPKLWEERINLVGFCLLIRKKVLSEIGYFDEDFSPGNYEDDDLSIRMIKSGYSLILCKDTFIHHHGSKSFKSNFIEYNELLRKNGKKFENKWGFNRDYSLFIRNDLINMIPVNEKDDLNFLEVGCACGATLLKIKNIFKNSRLYGIELNTSAAEIAKKFAQVSTGDVEYFNFEYPKYFFDYIILADILEHLKNPWDFLSAIKEYLKDDGSVLTSMPNVMHISIIRKLLSGRWQYSESGILDKTHLRFFTLNEIIEMFSSCGFKIANIFQNSVNISEEEKLLMENLNSFCGIEEAITDRMKAYQYIFEAKKV